MEVVINILFIVYVIVGYWSTGKTVYANKIVFHKFGELFLMRLILGTLFGWALIPWALIKSAFFH